LLDQRIVPNSPVALETGELGRAFEAGVREGGDERGDQGGPTPAELKQDGGDEEQPGFETPASAQLGDRARRLVRAYTRSDQYLTDLPDGHPFASPAYSWVETEMGRSLPRGERRSRPWSGRLR